MDDILCHAYLVSKLAVILVTRRKKSRSFSLANAVYIDMRAPIPNIYYIVL